MFWGFYVVIVKFICKLKIWKLFVDVSNNWWNIIKILKGVDGFDELFFL